MRHYRYVPPADVAAKREAMDKKVQRGTLG